MNQIDIMSFINLPIVAVCFLVGYVIKNYIKRIPNKYIPLIMIGIGIIVSISISTLSSNMDITKSIISGAISGLASTGSYEFIVNTFGLKTNKDTTNDNNINTKDTEDLLDIEASNYQEDEILEQLNEDEQYSDDNT